MKNTNLIIIGSITIIIIVVFAFSGYYYLNQDSSDSVDKMAGTETMMEDDSNSGEAMMEEDKAMMEEDGSKMASTSTKYVQFEDGTLESIEGEKVLFFYADWCSTCRPADKDIQENVSSIPDGLTVVRVNYNDSDTDQAEEDLADSYKVAYQHTFVQLDENGEEITRWSGGSFDELLENIK